MNKPLPIGIEDYKELIENNYYYVDKTGLVKELLDNRSKVTLFMRPRRFGKTLDLSMLKYYFEKTCDENGNEEERTFLFKGMNIISAGDEYTRHMGQYPVISLSLKSAKQPDFTKALLMLKRQIAEEFRRHQHETATGQSRNYLIPPAPTTAHGYPVPSPDNYWCHTYCSKMPLPPYKQDKMSPYHKTDRAPIFPGMALRLLNPAVTRGPADTQSAPNGSSPWNGEDALPATIRRWMWQYNSPLPPG